MRIQQLIYAIEIEKQGSINAAANKLFISQPTLSIAVKELENEIGFKLFKRTNKGIIPTDQGIDFIYYAKNVVLQMDSLTNYCNLKTRNFSNTLLVSTQHYAFVSDAFIKYLKDIKFDDYKYKIKETQSIIAIEDVVDEKSDIAIILKSPFNIQFLDDLFEKKKITYNKIADVSTHVFLSKNHPLATKETISLKELKPYPVVVFEQEGSELFAEELIIQSGLNKVIYINDRATSMNVISETNAYNLGTGYLCRKMLSSGLIAIPLENDVGQKEIGWIHLEKNTPSTQVLRFIDLVRDNLDNNK